MFHLNLPGNVLNHPLDLNHIDRLADKKVYPCVVGLHDQFFVRNLRDHDALGSAAHFAQSRYHLDPIHIGHQEIHQHHIGIQRHNLCRVGGLALRITAHAAQIMAFNNIFQVIDHRQIVFYNIKIHTISSSSISAGIITRNSVPTPSSDFTSMEPWNFSSTVICTPDRPTPR